MTVITGEMAVMLDVLGLRKGDSRILDAIILVGPDIEVQEFDFDGEKSTHYTFKATGTDLIFEEDVLESVMVRTQPDVQDESYGLYPRPAALVDGLSPTATRTEVASFLGIPERTGPNFDRYEVNDRYLHVEFDSDNRLARLSSLLYPI